MQFVESVFPYNSSPTEPSSLSFPVSDWIPPLITVSSTPQQQLTFSAPSPQRLADVSPAMDSSPHPSSSPSSTAEALPSITSSQQTMPQVLSPSSHINPLLPHPLLASQPPPPSPPQNPQHPMITTSSPLTFNW